MDQAAKLKQLSEYKNETEQLFAELCDRYKLPSLIIENENAIQDSVQTFMNFHQAKR